MSQSDRSDRRAKAAESNDAELPAPKQPLATSYLPLWFLLAFCAVVACGVLTK
jgi:hypothetical protein